MSNESVTITTSSAEGVTVQLWEHGECREAVALRGMFDVVVIDAARFRLVPKCELAKSLLSMWMQGDIRRVVTMQADAGPLTGRDWKYGRGTQYMECEIASRPMLASGDDPYHTGMSIKPEEYAAARAAVEKIRAAASPRKTSRRRAL